MIEEVCIPTFGADLKPDHIKAIKVQRGKGGLMLLVIPVRASVVEPVNGDDLQVLVDCVDVYRAWAAVKG